MEETKNVLQLRYLWAAGSMPPPEHYEYEIVIEDLYGHITFWPDYPGSQTPKWIREFSISTEAKVHLLQILGELDIFSKTLIEPEIPQTGGSVHLLKLVTDDQKKNIPSNLSPDDLDLLSPLYSVIQSLVPREIMQHLFKNKEAYDNEYYS